MKHFVYVNSNNNAYSDKKEQIKRAIKNMKKVIKKEKKNTKLLTMMQMVFRLANNTILELFFLLLHEFLHTW